MISLCGCASWPPEGHGGMAEHHQGEIYSIMPDQPIGPEHGLRFDLELTRRHLDILVIEGAELCFPATVKQANQRHNRIIRELHGGLNFDAANDLLIQRKLLAQLERQLDYVTQHNICSTPLPSGQQIPENIDKHIFELLNSDNQFAFSSSELNPKYIARLAEATQYLKNLPHYQLHITGHADSLGDKQNNRELSLERAKKVGRYLQILGLPSNRFTCSAAGSDEPLFEGKKPETRLTNRRVSIELIKNPDLIQKTRQQ